jgi:hypothetical protein
MSYNLLQRLDDAMRVNVALMDEATIDNAQLIRLLDIKLLAQAIECTRALFTSLGGTLPNAISVTVAPIEGSGRFFTLANRILQRNVQQQSVRALERDPLAKSYSDLLSALSVAQHIARQVRRGIPLRNNASVAQRIRNTAELFRAFRLQAWIQLATPRGHAANQ